MAEPTRPSPEALKRLADFLAGRTGDRVFAHPTGHPSVPTGFCFCDRPLHRQILFYIKATLLQFLLTLPFERPKVWMLRKLGASVGRNVYIAPGVWIDPMFPQLLTLEDNVFIGTEAKLILHEFRPSEFRAGRILIRREALVGGFAIIGPGVEIGERATVAAGAVVGTDVPAGATALGNPARIVRKPAAPEDAT